MKEEMLRYIDSIGRMWNNADYVFPDDTEFDSFLAKREEFISQYCETKKENDAFLELYFGELEAKQKLTDEDKAGLEEFAKGLKSGTASLDDGILLRISTLLYKSAMAGSDLNEQVKCIYNRAFYEYAVKRMAPDYSFFRGFEEIDAYKDLYELLSLEGKKYFMRCWCNKLLHLGYSWQERKAVLDFVLEKKEEDPENGLPYSTYILTLYRNIKNIQSDIMRNDSNGEPNDPVAIKLACEASDYIYENMSHMKNTPMANRMSAVLSYHTAHFHAGLITFDELMRELDKLSVIEDDYSLIEKSSVYFRIGLSKAIYAQHYGNNYSASDLFRLVASQFDEASKFISELKTSEFNSSIAVEYWAYLENMIELMRFDKVKPYFEFALRAMDNDLYSHSAIVAGLSVLICEYLLESKPGLFTDGEKYMDTKDVLSDKDGITDISFTIGMLHDIGMYRFLNMLKIRHRSLTEGEQEVLNSHVRIADRSLRETKIPEIIGNAINYHHKPYTENKCGILEDILHFANDLEKNTNRIIVNPEETVSFEEFIKKAEELSGKEYNPDIISAAESPVLREKLDYFLGSVRYDFMYRCCTGKKCSIRDEIERTH